MVVLWRRLGLARDPIEDVGVGAVEQCLVAIELAIVKPRQMRISKSAEDQVALLRPAVPGTV